MTDYFLGTPKILPAKEKSKEIHHELGNLTLNDAKVSMWMAPEIVKQELATDKADIYSLSMILYQLFVGHSPFHNVKGPIKNTINSAANGLRPEIPSDPRLEKLAKLLGQMWNADPDQRPNSKRIASKMEKMAVQWTVVDQPAANIWIMLFRDVRRVNWQRFQKDIQTQLGPFTNDKCVASLHAEVADSNDWVNLTDFARLVQCYGPLDQRIAERVHHMERQDWFHGHLTSSDAEKKLKEKIKGTYLVRWSSRTEMLAPLTISVLNNKGLVKHYKIVRRPGQIFVIRGEEYHSIDELLTAQREALQLYYPCSKDVAFPQADFWDHKKPTTIAVMPLKALCMRLISRNQQLFPIEVLERTMPTDLMEEYYTLIIHSLTNDDGARYLWRTHFLRSLQVPWEAFQFQLSSFLALAVNDQRWLAIRTLLSDIGDTSDFVHLDTFSQMLDCFGPLDNKMMDRIMVVVTKDWFHGVMSHGEAEGVMLDQARAEKGTFLVRTTSKYRGCFTISVVAKQRAMLHYRVQYNPNSARFILGKRECRSLEEVLVVHHRQLYLRSPCPGSKYRALGDLLA